MVSEAMLPRAAVREVEQRLTAAGCPDADFDARELFRLATGRDVRLSDRPLDAAEAEKMITVLMGDQIEDRKRYIQTHANFNKEDSFIKEVRK